MLRVKLNEEFERLGELLKSTQERQKRLRALERTVAYKAAEQLRDEVKKKAPTNPELKPYVDGLDVQDIDGHPNALAVTAELTKKLSAVDTSKTLAIFPARAGEPVFPVAAILRSYEPWAVDQLPPVTAKSVAFREVTEGEVDAARAANVLTRPTVDKLLQQAGVKLGSEFVVSGVAMLDLANLALRIEFGAPGVPRAMHWRPAVKKAKRGEFVKNMARDPEFQRFVAKTLFDAGFGAYTAEAPPTDDSIKAAEAATFQDFQKRLG